MGETQGAPDGAEHSQCVTSGLAADFSSFLSKYGVTFNFASNRPRRSPSELSMTAWSPSFVHPNRGMRCSSLTRTFTVSVKSLMSASPQTLMTYTPLPLFAYLQ